MINDNVIGRKVQRNNFSFIVLGIGNSKLTGQRTYMLGTLSALPITSDDKIRFWRNLQNTKANIFITGTFTNQELFYSLITKYPFDKIGWGYAINYTSIKCKENFINVLEKDYE